MCSVGQNQPGLRTAVLEVARGTQAKRELGTHNSSYSLSPGTPLPGLSLPRNGQHGRAERVSGLLLSVASTGRGGVRPKDSSP